MSDKLKLGVDIGGTSIKFAVVGDDGIVFKDSIPTEKSSTEKFLSEIADKCKEIMAKYEISQIGAGTPGYIENGSVLAFNIPLKNVMLAEELSKRIGKSVKIENDGNCAALGEYHFGSNGKYKNMVLLALGTGVGGGIIIDGKICQGRTSTGEVGHFIVQAEGGLPCPCGQKGCFEQYASATALCRYALELAEQNVESILYQKYVENGKQIEGKTVFQALDKGCPIAKIALEKLTDWLIVGLKSIIALLSPDAIVLAGGITEGGTYLIDSIHAKFDSPIPIEISKLKSEAGVMGAASL